MDTYQIFEFLLELNQEAANELIKTYHDLGNKSTRLIFPKINSKFRVSEQELRMAMISLLRQFQLPELHYTIETPTDDKYCFKGTNKRSGSSDLSFYEGNKKILNVEFKSKNPSQKDIDKDIDKLVTENCYGAWCHIFENEDSGTLKSMFQKLKLALYRFNAPKKPLYFSFLVLKKRILISRKGLDSDLLGFNPDCIFDLQYSEYKNLPNINTQIRDWRINKF
jgi:hypothetical protein